MEEKKKVQNKSGTTVRSRSGSTKRTVRSTEEPKKTTKIRENAADSGEITDKVKKKKTGVKLSGKDGSQKKESVKKKSGSKQPINNETEEKEPVKKTVKKSPDKRNPYLTGEMKAPSRFDSVNKAKLCGLFGGIIAAAVLIFILVQVFGSSFLIGTTLNGCKIGGQQEEEARAIMQTNVDSLHLILQENGNTVFDRPLNELGVKVDFSTAEKALGLIREKQNTNRLVALFKKKDYAAPIEVSIDDEVFSRAFTENCLSGQRVKAQNATAVFNRDGVTITPEVPGTEVDPARLAAYVKEALVKKLSGNFYENPTLELESAAYKEADIVVSTFDEIKARWEKIMNMTITYTFGDVTHEVGWKEISQMIYVDENRELCFKDEPIKGIAAALGLNYNTRYKARYFTTHAGEEIKMAVNCYGYVVDEVVEPEQIKLDIAAGESVVREPCYEAKGLSRNGNEDFFGTYVEVDLTKQHLWMYVDNVLVVETDVVTGCKNLGTETAEGAFTIFYKASPFRLTGGGGDGVAAWDEDVDYWMPFYDGQGLHDASWRSTFGGQIYVYSGSHGCVNLPPKKAAEIYYYCQENMPIFLYKS